MELDKQTGHCQPGSLPGSLRALVLPGRALPQLTGIILHPDGIVTQHFWLGG